MLRAASEIVRTDPLFITPIRDVNDMIVMQTAIIGDAEVLCTKDEDFFKPPAPPLLQGAGIEILDDLALLRRLRSKPLAASQKAVLVQNPTWTSTGQLALVVWSMP